MKLLNQRAYINGEWVCSKSEKVFEVFNPADGSVVGSVPDLSVSEVQGAIDAASEAFLTWKDTTAKERSILLRRWAVLMDEHKNEIAAIITAECGKPLAESLGEIGYGNSFLEWFSEEARRINGEIVPSPNPANQILMYKQPIGVVSLITPWNFPHAMITRKAGAALAAGCTCVIKPSEDTPFTALACAELAHEAGIPRGVINVVTTSRENVPDVGILLCQSPQIAGMSFTGSTEVGKLLNQLCAKGIKRVGLELGGNAPYIVFDSANLDKAVEGAMASRFRNCGQTCVSANRFLIHAEVFDEFVNKLKSAMQKLVVGNGAESGTTMGPLVNKMQAAKVNKFVNDARDKGANVLLGGEASSKGELFYEPTLLTNITPDMAVYTEEIFGPVAVCIPFNTEEEALTIANNTNRGLAGYFFTENIAQAFRVARKMEVGMVGLNSGMISATEAAFGGVKESGIGREGSSHGIDEYVYIKYLCIGGMSN